jgi:serine protease Do
LIRTLFAVLFFSGLVSGHAAAQASPRVSRGTDPAAVTDSRRSAIVEAARRVSPSVVSVTVIRRARQMANDPFAFFFSPRGRDREVQGGGTGFVISADGVVITNQHVTEGATQIVVTTSDGREFPATLLGEDALTDIAVLKIDGSRLTTAPIGRSNDLLIGEWVVAFGNPYQYLLGNSEPTVTAGVVSAVDRNLLPSGDQPGVYVGMIQTDAPINPGNSGGPLANAAGEIIGVNSSIFSNTGGSVGIGFAIPIERAIRVASELRRHGRVRRAWVGLEVENQITRDWKQAGGLRVKSIGTGSPAARAGLRTGDVMLRAQDRQLRTYLDWEGVKLDIGVGDSLRVTYRRAGRDRTTAMVVEDLPTTRAEKVAVLGDLQVVTVTSAIRAERSIVSQTGALIYEISPDATSGTGLVAGDVIVTVNRQAITSAEQLRQLLRAAQGNAPLRIYFERGGQIGMTEFYVQ